jgi:hypothetical protein
VIVTVATCIGIAGTSYLEAAIPMPVSYLLEKHPALKKIERESLSLARLEGY